MMVKLAATLRRVLRWVAAIAVLTTLCWGAVNGYAALDRPITTVSIEGMTNAAQRAEVQAIVDAHVGRGVLSTLMPARTVRSVVLRGRRVPHWSSSSRD